MSRSIIALNVFHLSDRTVMKPYLICFGATATATLDLPVRGQKERHEEMNKNGYGTLWWPWARCGSIYEYNRPEQAICS